MVLTSQSATAHDVTILPQISGKSAGLSLYYGDPGDYGTIDKVRLVSLGVFDAKGTRISFLHDVQRGADGKVLTASALRLGDWPSGTYVVESRYDNGFFVHDAENRAISTTKEWYPDPIDSAHYRKFSKALFHIGSSTGGYDRVVGHRLELVPHADPFAVADRAALPVEVRFDGKPLAGATVEVGDDTLASKGAELTTNAQGVVRVPLDRKGWFRLAVDHRSPSPYPALYDFDDFTATLVFDR
jgi:uncharacterized GH25 family protein